uniref:Uncharacterized protein n=1 Tax=Staphylococcus phage 184DA TaxID=3110532 RepID=A0AAU6MXG6_9CAUD
MIIKKNLQGVYFHSFMYLLFTLLYEPITYSL